MADTNAMITSTNAKIAGTFGSVNWMTVLGWIIFAALVIGGGWYIYSYYKNRKIFNKRITAFEIVSGEWKPCIRDVAKVVKIGKGGFEILYLKRLKTWKIAYGGRIGMNDYYFFILPDGYWYNGSLLANINKIDKNGGLIPVTTTNPLMRGQYTALEKQIDVLHADKASFWEKNGNMVMSIAFILISGVLLWLMFKEWRLALNQLSGYHAGLENVLDKLAALAGNIQGTPVTTGLVPA